MVGLALPLNALCFYHLYMNQDYIWSAPRSLTGLMFSITSFLNNSIAGLHYKHSK